MVPNGWNISSIDSISDSVKVGFVGSCQKDYRDSGIPLIRTTNLKNGKLDLKNIIYVTNEFHIKNKKSQLKEYDLLIARHGNHGSACMVPKGFQDANCLNIVIVRPDLTKVAPEFMLDLFNYSLSKKLSSKAAGSTQTVVNTKEIASQVATVPPLSEQRKIAKILSTWDKAINTTERLIDNSKQQKKALMQQLLTGKKRLLDDSGKPFEGEWEQVAFGDVVKILSRKYNPVKATQCLPCIELEHIEQESGRIIGSANASDLASIKNHFSAGSVIFGKLRPYLRKFARPNFDGVCSTEIWVFETKTKLLDEYLFHFVQMDKFISEANKSAGSKMPRADWGVVSELVIKIPCIAEQLRIANILTNSDKNIDLLQRQLDDLKKEKKALMQQLLTGKRRVKVDDKEVA